MTFARGVFIFAFVRLIVGAVGARLIIGPLLFGDVSSPSYSVSARAATATPAPTSRPPATVGRPPPTATPVPPANYWVGPTSTRPGTTIEVGYVIDNQTGKTEDVELGASVKASSRLNWATDSVS